MIGIIGIILSITLPALMGARNSAERLLSKARLKELHAAIELYADSSDGMYPSVDSEADYPMMGGTGTFRFPYWQIHSTWYAVIWDVLPAEGSNLELFYSPGVERLDRIGQMPPSYRFSTSFAGRPELWSEKGEPRTRYQQSSRLHEVRYPSNKALLWDAEMGWVRDTLSWEDTDLAMKTPLAMADGSASERIPSEATAPYKNPIEHELDSARLHNTPSGVQGRDY